MILICRKILGEDTVYIRDDRDIHKLSVHESIALLTEQTDVTSFFLLTRTVYDAASCLLFPQDAAGGGVGGRGGKGVGATWVPDTVKQSGAGGTLTPADRHGSVQVSPQPLQIRGTRNNTHPHTSPILFYTFTVSHSLIFFHSDRFHTLYFSFLLFIFILFFSCTLDSRSTYLNTRTHTSPAEIYLHIYIHVNNHVY